MPELPFIQVLVEQLHRQIAGRRITGVRLSSPSVLKTVQPPLEAVVDRRIGGVRRAGKLVVCELDGDLLVVFHLMRNGRLQLAEARRRGGRDLAVAFPLDDGRALWYVEVGPKKRAALYLLPAAEAHARAPLAGLGPDALGDTLTPDRLAALLAGDSGQLKRVLTSQRHLAGIGTAYADEVLWAARLSPFAVAARLGPDEVARLHGAIRAVLGEALDRHREYFAGAPPGSEPVRLWRVHRHGGEPCPRCGAAIAVVHFTDRETYYCPQCQTGGKVYADRRLSRLLK